MTYDRDTGEAEAIRIWTEIGQSHKVRSLKRESFMQIREVMLECLESALKLNADQKAAYVAMVDFAYEHFLKPQGL